MNAFLQVGVVRPHHGIAEIPFFFLRRSESAPLKQRIKIRLRAPLWICFSKNGPPASIFFGRPLKDRFLVQQSVDAKPLLCYCKDAEFRKKG